MLEDTVDSECDGCLTLKNMIDCDICVVVRTNMLYFLILMIFWAHLDSTFLSNDSFAIVAILRCYQSILKTSLIYGSQLQLKNSLVT